ncbi:MAG: hypothetical protein EOO73_01180 [Myxococcales bacterium]|nr:MAG: hypothetical protein EOO73_01180 [Myxococcales bacterium]
MKHLVSSLALPLLGLVALGTTACGKAASPSYHSEAPVSAARPGGALAEGSSLSARQSGALPAAPAARSEGASADGAFEPSPAPKDDRPGLGTEWGETRQSRVSSAPFERADGDHPVSATSFAYNDESGVRAALGSRYWDRRTDGVSAARGAITVRVVDEGGSPLPTFSAGGRSYVMGNDGQRYSIRIENQTGARFEAVATVDGLDVIDGQPGSFEKRGYLVQPWSTVEIDGFRRTEEEVAAFRFGRVRDSYAAKRGSDRNVGVIGVAVFQERGSSYPWTDRELRRRDSADAFPGRFAPAP